jgi:hypothetical protein
VVINPNATDYAQVIPNLLGQKNVRLIGYIDVNLGNTSVDNVTDQIDEYAAWGASAPTLALDGVFFDQTPSGDSNADAEYLTEITQHARNQDKLGNFVCHSKSVLIQGRA